MRNELRSFETQVSTLVHSGCLALLILLGMPLGAEAGQAESARRNLNLAYESYTEAVLSQAKQAPLQYSDIQKMNQKFIAPAQAELSRARVDGVKHVFATHGVRWHEPGQHVQEKAVDPADREGNFRIEESFLSEDFVSKQMDRHEKIMIGQLNGEERKRAGRAPSSRSSGYSGGGEVFITPQNKPGEALDGKGIPRFLDFSKDSKK